MTDEEIMAELRAEKPSRLERVRRVLSGECGRAEQAAIQRVPPTPLEWKRMEFEGAKRLIEAMEQDVITALLTLLDQIEIEDDASLAAGRFKILEDAGYDVVWGEKGSGSVQ